jgi:hypothetical protein
MAASLAIVGKMNSAPGERLVYSAEQGELSDTFNQVIMGSGMVASRPAPTAP